MGGESGDCLFVQFAREPVAGAVKTRMLPRLTPEQACELHCELVLRTARTLSATGLGPAQLAVAGELAHPLFERCRGLGLQLCRQRGADLGERMYNALSDGLERFQRVVLVGSDCPGIDNNYLQQAADALVMEDIVIGPAADGGYVLLGVRRVRPEMFAGIPWGTGSVFAKTVASLRRLGLDWAELPALADIDRPEDLAIWETLRGA